MIPSTEVVRSFFGAAAAASFAFAGLIFGMVEDEIGFGMVAFGLCFLSLALTFRWTDAVERLRRR